MSALHLKKLFNIWGGANDREAVHDLELDSIT